MAKLPAGFEDIGHGIDAQQGIFDGTASTMTGGSAMTSYRQPQTQAAPQGVLITLACEGCGKQREMVVEYPELIAIKYGLQPHQAYARPMSQGQQILHNPVVWGYDQDHQMWFPDYKCSCGWPIRPLISLQEAQHFLNQATSRGWLPQQHHDALSQYCYNMKAQRG